MNPIPCHMPGPECECWRKAQIHIGSHSMLPNAQGLSQSSAYMELVPPPPNHKAAQIFKSGDVRSLEPWSIWERI